MNQSSNAASAAADRQHYFLLCGEIVYQMPERKEFEMTRLNTVAISKDGQLTAAHIGRAQQAMQVNFFKRINDPAAQVLDLVILSIASLGQFTAEEFNATSSTKSNTAALGNG